MVPPDPPISRSDQPNQTRASRRRSPYDYHRIADRYTRPKPSTSLRTIILWIFAGIAALYCLDRFRLQQPRPQPDIVVATPVTEEDATKPVAAPSLDHQSDQTQSFSAIEPAPPASTPVPTASETEKEIADRAKSEKSAQVRLSRDKSGNYVGEGTINQKQVKLLADTGASVVVIPEKIARRIGLKAGKAIPFRTAGGIVNHYATTLDSITVGPILIQNVQAVINPNMQEDFALLGMNVLELLHMTQQDGYLILSYDAPTGETGSSDAHQAAGVPAPFKKSVRECLGPSKTINQRTLDCLQGN